MDALRLCLGEQLDPEVLEHLPHERACLLVELPPERPAAAVEHEDADVELRDVVGRLEPEEAGADDHGRSAARAADVLLDLDGVVDRPENEAPVRAEAFERRDERPRARGDDHLVVLESFAVGGRDLTVLAVDLRGRHSALEVDAPDSAQSRRLR